MRYFMGAFTLVLVFSVASPSFAAQRTTTLGGVRGSIGSNVVTGGTFGTTGGGVSQLTSHDCWAVGGTVITPGDDRCGVGGKYCRLPDTNAICIQEAAQ
jgi:hypothetical protein